MHALKTIDMILKKCHIKKAKGGVVLMHTYHNIIHICLRVGLGVTLFINRLCPFFKLVCV